MADPTSADLALDLPRLLDECEASLIHMGNPPSDLLVFMVILSRAVAAEAEVTHLRQQIVGHVERIAAQAEILGRRAEGREARLEAALHELYDVYRLDLDGCEPTQRRLDAALDAARKALEGWNHEI